MPQNGKIWKYLTQKSLQTPRFGVCRLQKVIPLELLLKLCKKLNNKILCLQYKLWYNNGIALQHLPLLGKYFPFCGSDNFPAATKKPTFATRYHQRGAGQHAAHHRYAQLPLAARPATTLQRRTT